MDIRLNFELPFFKREWYDEYKHCERNNDEAGMQDNIDKRTDIFASLMALYPITETKKLAEEFSLPIRTIVRIASMFHIKKSKEFRSRINSQNAKAKYEK